EPSEQDDKDKIVAQNPHAGAQLAAGRPVTLTVGDGPEKRSVPDVSGQTLDKAVANLEGAGFRVDIVDVDGREEQGTVLRTDPVGGEKADTDSEIRVFVSNGALFAMPVLPGKSRSEAVTALRAAGWSGDESRLDIRPSRTLDPTAVGKVTAQEPGQ